MQIKSNAFSNLKLNQREAMHHVIEAVGNVTVFSNGLNALPNDKLIPMVIQLLLLSNLCDRTNHRYLKQEQAIVVKA